MRAILSAAAMLAAAPAFAQSMPGMTMPRSAEPSPPAKSNGVAKSAAAADEPVPSGTALAPGDARPPPVPTNHYADRTYDAALMDAARRRMMAEEGGRAFHQILFNLAELQIHDGRAGYRWDGEGWIGGDIDRFVVKSEGEGARDGLESGEVQALFSHAIGPYFDAQAGIRHDIAPTPTRTYATIGVEGLAPYELQVEARLFLSTRGELIGRIEGWYDERVMQRLVLQPRIELNLAAQDLRDDRIGAGLSDAEFGLRLRYEITRAFAPYLGVSYEARTGRTADYARIAGRDTASTSLVTGVRFWF